MSDTQGGGPIRRLTRSLGFDRRELRAWAMYDWALSAQETTIGAAVFPIFFAAVAAAGLPDATRSQYWAWSNSASTAVIALLSPFLGALADYTASKRRLLASFLVVGTLGTAGMFLIQRGDLLLAALLYTLSSIGAASSRVFYESLLPHIASEKEIDRVSSAGYAFGYLGGGLLLALNLTWIMRPDWFGLPSGPDLSESQSTLPTRLALLSVAVWWLVFSIPLFRHVPEPPARFEADERRGQNPVRVAGTRLVETFRELRTYRQAFLMLLAFLIYNDGVNTIQRMAVIYGAEIGIGRNDLIAAILIAQFVGVPFTFLFGMFAGRLGAKRSIFVGLTVYLGISVLGYFMRTATHFYLLAVLVAIVQGGTQALSRSLFATLIPAHRSGEFFGFYSVFSKFAGIFGPLVFGLAITLTGSSRGAIASLIGFFVVGGALLAMVDVEEGERAARAAEAAARPVPEPAGVGGA